MVCARIGHGLRSVGHVMDSHSCFLAYVAGGLEVRIVLPMWWAAFGACKGEA